MPDADTRIAVDIGGTFTDLVATRDGQLVLEKVPTTPDDYTAGVMSAVERTPVDPAQCGQFVHGTTVVINALTERTGVETALITTEGFRDVLDITRANRPDMFNFRYQKPEPFVPRRHRWEVTERVDPAGEVLEPLSEADVREAVEDIEAAGIGSIAVAYLNAYRNPVHERRTREIVAEAYPEAYVSLSHELTREYREYERTNTAVLNAYVRPISERYLGRLEDRLSAAGLRTTPHAMKSNAGTSRFSEACRRPVELVESGPVGGVYGAARVGDRIDEPDVISFDMGGTTAKTSLIEDGEVSVETEYWLERTATDEGYPLKVPVVDIVEVGAGGGSVAWVDQGGSMAVGPRSAGADPGPACYDRGGAEPTVTDANLVTRRLNPDYFLGGEMSLSVDRAERAIETVADRFDRTVRETAHGILRVVNSNMANTLKQVSIRRGYDPRDFVLVASGGAGGLHAPSLGRELGVKAVVIPRAPGQFSAWGMLMTDVRKDFVRTRVLPFDPDRTRTVADLFEEMAAEARESYEQEGVDPAAVAIDRAVDLRYAGQEHTVRTPVPSDGATDTVGGIDRDRIAETIDRFHELHAQHYNFRLDDPVEAVDLHLVATSEVPKPTIEPIPDEGSKTAARKGSRAVDFDVEGELETPVFERGTLPPQATVEGPALVEEPASTVLVHPDQTLRIDPLGNLRIQ